MDGQPDEILTPAQAAELLGISTAALAQRRHRARKLGDPGQSPPWHLNQREEVRYLRSEVLAWDEARNANRLDLLRPDPTAPRSSDA